MGYTYLRDTGYFQQRDGYSSTAIENSPDSPNFFWYIGDDPFLATELYTSIVKYENGNLYYTKRIYRDVIEVKTKQPNPEKLESYNPNEYTEGETADGFIIEKIE